MGNGSVFDGVRLTLNAEGQLDNIQKWFLNSNINLTTLSGQKGVFADVNLDESVIVFLNIFSGSNSTDNYYHKQQVNNVLINGINNIYQNYQRNANGYITTFDRTDGAGTDRSYTITYTEK